ncbi:unnamed protein product [Dicrocoelium dendriticum]|nr:unnamed protein product [Dicrocoelium dendriticum]
MKKYSNITFPLFVMSERLRERNPPLYEEWLRTYHTMGKFPRIPPYTALIPSTSETKVYQQNEETDKLVALPSPIYKEPLEEVVTLPVDSTTSESDAQQGSSTSDIQASLQPAVAKSTEDDCF